MPRRSVFGLLTCRPGTCGRNFHLVSICGLILLWYTEVFLIWSFFLRRPGDVSDVFHTFFGICGLSLLGYTEDDDGGYEGLKKVDPVYALPVHTLQRMGIPIWRE